MRHAPACVNSVTVLSSFAVRIKIEPFDRNRDTGAAAQLLSARHRRDRTRDPRLPQAFEDPGTCRQQVEHAFDTSGWYGAAASIDGRPAGFLIMTPQLTPSTSFLANFFPPRGASAGYGAHAAAEEAAYDVYRELYAACAEHFVAQGFFDHSVSIPARDREAHRAFASLSFGQTMACAVRDVAPVERPAAAVSLHQGGAEDLDVVMTLAEELTLHHAKPPIMNPYIRESDPAARDFQKNLLADPAANAHWVAYDGDRPVGMNSFMQPFFLSPMTVPDKTVYLFQGIVAEDARVSGVGSAVLSRGVSWARDQGYQHVALHFATANLSGAKFWQSSGFQPVEYGMRRRIDERVAWAHNGA
jgi:GNAT superfamily N-acetyltransferase